MKFKLVKTKVRLLEERACTLLSQRLGLAMICGGLADDQFQQLRAISATSLSFSLSL